MTTPKILDQNEFFEALSFEVNQASDGDRVAMSTMSYEPAEPITSKLITDLSQASLRGADVHLAIDSYARMYHGKRFGPITFNRSAPTDSVQRIDDSVSFLEEAGVECGFVNQPTHAFSLLFAGRSHLKLNIVNDRVFLGGPNLHGTDRADLVADFTDKNTADFLARIIHEVISTGSTDAVLGKQDHVIGLSPEVAMILDSGIKGKSTIYEVANEMLDRVSSRIVLGSQFLPDRALIKKLLKAIKRDVEVTVIGNEASRHDQMRLAHIVLDARKKIALPRGVLIYAGSNAPKFHAKGLVCDDEALIGTHNLTNVGVQFGTPEICLAVKNGTFARNLGSKMLALAS